jgi:hypothetical protein
MDRKIALLCPTHDRRPIPVEVPRDGFPAIKSPVTVSRLSHPAPGTYDADIALYGRRLNRFGTVQGGRRAKERLYRLLVAHEEPRSSNFSVLGKGKRVFDVDPEIAHRVLDPAVT